MRQRTGQEDFWKFTDEEMETETGQRRAERMVFVCDHCHYELEAAAKPGQCPDCGKLGRILSTHSGTFCIIHKIEYT